MSIPLGISRENGTTHIDFLLPSHFYNILDPDQARQNVKCDQAQGLYNVFMLNPAEHEVLLTVPRRYFFCGSFMFHSVLCLLCLCARLFIGALWSPAGNGLTSWFLFVVSNCEFVTFPLVSWVRCGT